jgi:excisionase family DNA binding protein
VTPEFISEQKTPLTRLAVSLHEGARAIGVSRTKMYGLISENQIATFKVGRRHLVRPEDLRAFVEKAAGTASA